MSALLEPVSEPPITALPPMLRGVEEVAVYLRLPVEFINLWLNAETPNIPALPCFQAGGTKIFNTAAVLAWLAKHHGYGDGMKSPKQRPKITRSRAK